MSWLNIGAKGPLWDREDEGGGGGGEGSADETIRALTDRLSRMGQQMQTMQQESQSRRLQDELNQYESQLSTRVASSETAVQTAEANLAKAFDEGDGATIARAQRELTEAVTSREQAKTAMEGFKARIKEAERKRPEAPRNADTSGSDLDTKNLDAWKNKHSEWYGVDKDMTKAAHEIDGQIREAGVIPVGSQKYFDAIDRQMKQRFPDRFGGSPDTYGGDNGGRDTGGPRRGRIPQSVFEGWRRMGINVDDPKTVERMLGHRDTAVSKGILTQEPVRDRVISR